MSMAWASACALTDLSDGIPLGVTVDEVAVCVVVIGPELFAIHDECTHEAVPLSEGDVEDCIIECWRHGSRFDLRTGSVLNPPALKDVTVYPIRLVEGQVQVDVAG